MLGDGGATGEARVEAFIARWRGSEGAERAAYAQFLHEFCLLIGVEPPRPPKSVTEAVDYRYEYPVRIPDGQGGFSVGRIDLYRKAAFVLEAKQSRWKGQKKALLLPADATDEATHGPRGRRGADRAWDVMMLHARRQAEDYARGLPVSHGWPPFLIICDVGHCFEFYADFSGQGKNYAQFPDRHRFRIHLEDLRKPEVRDWLRRVWEDPYSLDPARQAAMATRQITERLAAISRALETRYDPEAVAVFLMRCIFTMFAEDVRLIPADSFKRLLRECRENPPAFKPLVEDLWRTMDRGGYSTAVRAEIKRFNGRMFADPQVFPLGEDGLGDLLAAAEHDWSRVEPAIFGGLFEQALDPDERARLGAHYTPRAYVERLVFETVIAPLRHDWNDVLTGVEHERNRGSLRNARALVADFHEKLSTTRVLDPACGTGNFLHVAQDMMKRLEGEVLEAANELGVGDTLGGFGVRGVGPWQFHGIDANRRSTAIADLMLWIGYLQWHLRTRAFAPQEPILDELAQIRAADALLDWAGRPVPAFEAGRETVPADLSHPEWPQAEFIVGNPPFMGGKDMRRRLGNGYVSSLQRLYPRMNESADLVMYWWDHAAELLTRPHTVLRRFGFVTTNSIAQVFQRRVIARHLGARRPVSILMAIPDHPWTKAGRDTAAVRIAMTVVAAGSHDGRLYEIISEADLDTDQPRIELREKTGRINADLTVGADVTRTASLLSNAGICSPGVKLHGAGFIVSPRQTGALGLGQRPGLERYIRHYRNGRDLTARPRDAMVLDLFGLTADEVRARFPEVYQHLKLTVKEAKDVHGTLVGRDANGRAAYAENWWIFGEPRRELRPALAHLQRYIATVETAKHRVFQFLGADILPDNMLIAVALSDAFHLGVLSSRIHQVWALRAGGRLGIGNDPRYSKSRCFDPFPFPDASEAQKRAIRGAAEALDGLRKQVLDARPELTLTALYNVREAIRAGRALSPQDETIRDRGLVLILNEHHEQIDRAVADAYGWPADMPDQSILDRLVTLNAVRGREETGGSVRWLRPDYQRPRFGRDGRGGDQLEAAVLLAPAASPAVYPRFPTTLVARIAAVLSVLTGTPFPLDATAVARHFRQGRRIEPAVRTILIALARVGEISTVDGGRSFSRRLFAGGRG